MSIAQIARFSAAYASFAKLVLVSSRGTSSVEGSFSGERGLPSSIGHGIWYTRSVQPASALADDYPALTWLAQQ